MYPYRSYPKIQGSRHDLIFALILILFSVGAAHAKGGGGSGVYGGAPSHESAGYSGGSQPNSRWGSFALAAGDRSSWE